MPDLRQVFNCVTVEAARETKDWLLDKYAEEPKLQKALEKLEAGFEDAIQFLHEPQTYHRHISSTNHLERLNQEVRRREKVIRIFPNTQSAFRLIGAVLMQAEERQLTKKRKII